MLADSASLALGDQHSVILKHDGSVWSTALTVGPVPSRSEGKQFVRVIASGAIGAAAGSAFSMVVKKDGTIWAVGRNYQGQLGDGTRFRKQDNEFFFVHTITGAKTVAAGSAHSMVLTQEGRVLGTGWNKYGQLGDGMGLGRTRFFEIISSEAKGVATGDIHSIILKQDGSVWAAGRNYNGQLGDGSKADRSSFVKVMSSGAVHVAAGGYHTVVIKEDGSVWTTGSNEYGQLGGGPVNDRAEYLQVVSNGAMAVAAGGRHSLVLKQDGSVWTTGYNVYGQLGDGSSTSMSKFSHVISDGVQGVAAGAFHSMVIKQDGSLWATGLNKDGQFGDGTTKSKKSFVRVATFGNGAGGTLHDQTHKHGLNVPYSIHIASYLLLNRLSVLFNLRVLLPCENYIALNSWLCSYNECIRHDCDRTNRWWALASSRYNALPFTELSDLKHDLACLNGCSFSNI